MLPTVCASEQDSSSLESGSNWLSAGIPMWSLDFEVSIVASKSCSRQSSVSYTARVSIERAYDMLINLIF